MVRRSAFIRVDSLVACAVVALLTGLLARTVERVRECSAQAETRAPAIQFRPASPTTPAARPSSAPGDEEEDVAAQARVSRRGGYPVGFPERRQP
jgi:hypothetical protein